MKRTTSTKQQFGLPDIGIPAEVLFHPKLTRTEKMLYGFILNIAHSDRGCFASNEWLAGLMGMRTPQTISNAINNLRQWEVIIVEWDKKQNRQIYLNPEYPKIYSQILTEKGYKGINNILLKKLYPPIIKIIPPYNKNYTPNIKEDSKEENKKEKKLNKKSSINLFNQYFSKEWKDDESFQKVLTEFITHRNQIRKPVTELAAKKLATKLTKYSCWVARTALQASVENSWTGVFPESVKSTDEDSTELPPQEIIQHYFKGKKDSMYADTFYEGTVCDAEDLLMDRTNGQCSQLARNVVALYDWIACTQTEEAREHRDIPSPGLLIGNYVMWLERQTGWLSIEPRLFTHDNSIFRRKFLPKESNEIGFDVITGKYFK